MNRTNRFALVAAVLLLLVLAGTTLATRAPGQDAAPAQQGTDPEAPDPEGLRHAAERLAASGIPADEGVLAELAGEYGVGGAVRVLAWASETGVSVQSIRDLRAEGKGWGVIARELGVHPGIGGVMGGGQGRDHAPGLQGDRGGDEDTDD